MRVKYRSSSGRLVALSRFLSHSVEHTLPFFKTLHRAKPFRWTKECQKAFDELKQYLTQLPSLVGPKHHVKLLLYLAALTTAVSVILVQEDNRAQCPINYAPEALQGAKTRYT